MEEKKSKKLIWIPIIAVLVVIAVVVGVLFAKKYDQEPTKTQEATSSDSAAPADQTNAANKPADSDVSYKISDIHFDQYETVTGERMYYGIVEITNDGTENLLLRECTFDLEDDNGHLLQSNSLISSCPDIIAPGEKGYFYNGLDRKINENLSLENGINLNPEEEVVKCAVAPVDYEISDLSIVNDTLGPTISGRVKNTTDKAASIVSIHALFYDENGKVIAIADTSITDLKAGKQKSFSIVGLTLPESVAQGNYSEYKVIARQSYYQY